MSFVEAVFLGLGYNRYNEIYWLEPRFDLRNGLRLLRNDYDSLRMRESALRNQKRVDFYCEHEVIANPEVIEPVEVSDDSEVEVGDGYVGDVEVGDGNQEKEAGVGNQEKEIADEVLCVPNQDAPAQVEEVSINQMNNNSAATNGENAEDNAGVSKCRGWRTRKKFPRPPLVIGPGHNPQ
ncbi:hypothetical protein PIB30_019186 [Stylosanthes scabra]|uniref:PB1-like domain-containing protein n=1 Tax=Stylosanthes scabra TaxID=79078 RepID=A0ABU6Z7R0_9FABA|nr:hypothetical protein [Stylosanthes scabra]